MKTLNISISEFEYNQLGIKEMHFSFKEFVEIIDRELTKQALGRSVELAEKYGLSRMTMGEITKEVKEARKNAKNNN